MGRGLGEGDFRTIFQRVTVGAQPRPIGKGACVSVEIQNTLNNIDVGTTANNIEIMIGDASAQVYQMLPGQQSPKIYAQDLDEIFARTRVVGESVNITLIVHKVREKLER